MVSRSAPRCPHCGRPFAWAQPEAQKPAKGRGGRDLRFAGGFLLFIFGVGTIAGLMPIVIGAAGGLLGLIVYLAGRIAGGG